MTNADQKTYNIVIAILVVVLIAVSGAAFYLFKTNHSVDNTTTNVVSTTATTLEETPALTELSDRDERAEAAVYGKVQKPDNTSKQIGNGLTTDMVNSGYELDPGGKADTYGYYRLDTLPDEWQVTIEELNSGMQDVIRERFGRANLDQVALENAGWVVRNDKGHWTLQYVAKWGSDRYDCVWYSIDFNASTMAYESEGYHEC